MRAKLTAKHPRPATPERAPVRRGSATARKPARPAPAPADAGKPAAAKRTASGGATRPAQARPPRDAAEKPARPRRTGDTGPGARRDGNKPAFGRGVAGGERKSASSAGGSYARLPARNDVDADKRRDGERAPRFGGSRERDERPARRGDNERPARGTFHDSERPSRPRRDGDAPEKRGYTSDRRPARTNDRDRPAFSRERDGERPDRPRRDGDAPEKRSYASDRRPARTNDRDRPAFSRERDGERPGRPRRDGDTPEKRAYSSDRRPARANDNARPAPRRDRDDSDRRPATGERRVARPVKAAYGDRGARDEGTSAPLRVRTEASQSRSADKTGSLRLAKRMSELGLCSRREADEWIEKGWVYVDGERIDTLGAKVTPDQKIEIDPAARAAQARLVTILLHKPVGYVSSQAEDGYEPAITLVTGANHWDGDRSGLRFSAQHLRALAPAGRLDIDSTGLLVLTQDGRVAKQLIGEQSDIDKEYLVRVTYGDIETGIDQQFPPESLAKLRHGLLLDDVPLKPAMVSWQNGEQLRFVLREGKKRQIRRMCELVGLKVVGLKRVRMGRVLLGALPQGQWRYLTPEESF